MTLKEIIDEVGRGLMVVFTYLGLWVVSFTFTLGSFVILLVGFRTERFFIISLLVVSYIILIFGELLIPYYQKIARDLNNGKEKKEK